MNKKGFEIAVSVLVTLIIGILLFSMGMYFLRQMLAGGEELKLVIEQQTQREIERLMRDENALVAIPINTQTVRAGDRATFWVGIRNLDASKEFSMLASFDAAYDLGGNPISPTNDPNAWLGEFYLHEDIFVKQNEYKAAPISLRASGPKGLYVFNVCVFPTSTTTETTCYLDTVTPPGLYDRIRQITIEIR